MTPGLDCVVVNYRTAPDLHAFIESWDAFRPVVEANLLVLDVAPLDRAAVHVAQDAGVEYECVSDNIGYARACNLGASLGHSDVVALFNADVELRPRAVQDCYDALVAHDDWGVLGPRQVDNAGRLTAAGILGTEAAPKHRGWQQRDTGQYQDVVDVPTVAGSAYFCKRSVWDELTACPLYQQVAPGAAGAFLPTQHYYEETYCSYHARAHGHRVVYYGPVTIVHHWHRASPVGGEAERNMPEARRLFRHACDVHAIAHD